MIIEYSVKLEVPVFELIKLPLLQIINILKINRNDNKVEIT